MQKKYKKNNKRRLQFMKKNVSNLQKVFLIFIVCTMFCGVFTGCGNKKSEPPNATKNVIVTPKAEEKVELTEKTEKKKIIILKDGIFPTEEVYTAAIEHLKEKGYDDKTSEITELNMEGNVKNAEGIINKIKEVKPDVVISIVTVLNIANLCKPLSGTGIPVVQFSAVDVNDFVDLNGIPKENITGLTIFPKNIEINSVKLMNQVIPINNKKVVALNVDNKIAELIESGLKSQNIEIKESKIVSNEEEFKDLIIKYNQDNEVGWIVNVAIPSFKKDGTPADKMQLIKWLIENNKKPA